MRTIFRTVTLAACLCSPARLAQASDSWQGPEVPGWLQRYCFECHDQTTHRAGLRLDELSGDLSQRPIGRRWEAIYDKIATSQMPPRKAEQPSSEERAALVKTIGAALRTASLERQRTQGRAPLRRLPRTAYENTLRDLLSLPALEVQDLLPAEPPQAGFDAVGAAQPLSSTHLVGYQEAADRALAAAVPSRAVAPLHINLTGRQFLEASGKRRDFETWKCWLNGDALVIPSSLWRPHLTIANPPAPAAGRYRFRVTGYGLHTSGAPLPVAFNTMQTTELLYGKDLAWRDLPADKPGVAEVELGLQAGQVVDVMGWTLPHRDDVKGKLKDQAGETWSGPSLVLERLEIDGPLGAWPPESYQRLFGDLPLRTRAEAQAEQDHQPAPKPREQRSAAEWRRDPLVPWSLRPRDDADRLIRAFLPRAFRRPASEEMQRHYVKMAWQLLDSGRRFDEAMIETYKAVLCSPHFLFLAEAPGPLDRYALASRLSYFLWNTLPDGTLLAAAEKDLDRPEVLRREVDRLLDDPRAQRFVRSFTGQWLDLQKIDATTPDKSLYPEFDRLLQESSVRETELFFAEMLKHDRSLLEFVHSDWTFLNRRLAEHYGVPIPEDLGYELRLTALPHDSHRGGVLTQASVLKVTADGTHTSPVLRGKWVCERILGISPPPPPADVAKIEPDIRGATSVRQQLAKHRSSANCASCHQVIDPPGFALESFDVIGGWREFYRVSQNTGRREALVRYPRRAVNRGPDVEKGDRLPDGRPFADIDEYKRLLLEDKDALARNLVKKVLAYATGADVQFADREVVEQIVTHLRDKKNGFRELIHEVTQSRCFHNK